MRFSHHPASAEASANPQLVLSSRGKLCVPFLPVWAPRAAAAGLAIREQPRNQNRGSVGERCAAGLVPSLWDDGAAAEPQAERAQLGSDPERV